MVPDYHRAFTIRNRFSLSDAFIILTKAPIPGQVKTRLIPFLSAVESASLARAFLGDLLETLRCFVTTDIEVAVPTADARHSVREVAGPGARLVDQGPGDLGARLARTSARRFARGARTVTLVGGDHPSLPAPYLARSIAAARQGRVGWILTRDGGFAAMSLPRPLPGLFRAVPWSTHAVAAAVRERARRERVVLVDAGMWYDVDSPDDLRRLSRELAGSRACPRTRAVLNCLDPPISRRASGTGERRS
ncbi:MAG: TIGR04282 family arsenosugar biosynthesis glycosyltransferase [Candidatus Eiseniibacteriota bacterium]